MHFWQVLVDAKFPPLGLHPKLQDVLLDLPVERQPIKVTVHVYFSGRLYCFYMSVHFIIAYICNEYFSCLLQLPGVAKLQASL